MSHLGHRKYEVIEITSSMSARRYDVNDVTISANVALLLDV